MTNNKFNVKPTDKIGNQTIVLDSHKMLYHLDKVRDWLTGKRIAPITMDIALTRRCNYQCKICNLYGYAMRS